MPDEDDLFELDEDTTRSCGAANCSLCCLPEVQAQFQRNRPQHRCTQRVQEIVNVSAIALGMQRRRTIVD